MTHAERDDDDLMVELGRALQAVDQVPPEVLAGAKAVYTWRTIDAELAALAYDSLLDTQPALVRSEAAAVRTLSFECDALVVEIDVTAGALIGQVVPPQPGFLEVRTATGPGERVTVDASGCFTVRPAPEGSFSLHVRTDSGIDVVTDRVTL